jgi:hypothetical protein
MAYVLSPLLSFAGGYGYFFLLSILFPLGQYLLLSRKANSKLIILWLLQIVLWFYFFVHEDLLHFNENNLAVTCLVSAVYGELVLSLSFKRFGKLLWFLSAALSYYLIRYGWKISGSNDFIQIVVIVLTYSLAATFSALALYFGFLKSINSK